jgi:hypothetical protein
VLAAAAARGMGAWAREWEQMFIPSVGLYLRSDPATRADILAMGRGAAGPHWAGAGGAAST